MNNFIVTIFMMKIQVVFYIALCIYLWCLYWYYLAISKIKKMHGFVKKSKTQNY